MIGYERNERNENKDTRKGYGESLQVGLRDQNNGDWCWSSHSTRTTWMPLSGVFYSSKIHLFLHNNLIGLPGTKEI